jgi:amino acid transporter
MGDVVMPHSLQGVLVQSTIAVLILVGFESCTALAAETVDPHRNIPRGVILSLVIQGLVCYLFEYGAACYMVGDKLTGSDPTGKALLGMDAAPRPARRSATWRCNSATVCSAGQFGFMMTIASVWRSRLPANTRYVSYAMPQIEILNMMHGGSLP